jgi:hypothetical protein
VRLTGSDPVPCAAVGFAWTSVQPERMRDTAHVYGQLAPLGQLRQGRLDLDVASSSPSAGRVVRHGQECRASG